MGRKDNLDELDLFAEEGDLEEDDLDEGERPITTEEPTYWSVPESEIQALERGTSFTPQSNTPSYSAPKAPRGFAAPVAHPTLSVDGEGFLDYMEMVENARRGHVKGFAPLLAHLYKYADGLEAYRNKWDGQLEGAAWEKVRNWPEPLPSPEDLSKYLQRRGGGAFSVRLFRDGKPLDGCIVQVDEIMTEPPKKAMSPDDLGPLLRGKKESELQDKMYDMVLQRIEGGDSKGAAEAFTAYRERAVKAEERLDDLEKKYEGKLEKIQAEHKAEMDGLLKRVESLQTTPKHTESDRLYGILESAIGGQQKGGDSSLVTFYQQQLKDERDRHTIELREERTRADKQISEQRERYEDKIRDQRDRYEDKLKDQKALFDRDLQQASSRLEQEIRELKSENKDLREKLEKVEKAYKQREESLQRDLKDLDRSLRSLELEKVTLSMKAQQGQAQTTDPFASLDNVFSSIQRVNGIMGKLGEITGNGRPQAPPEPSPQSTPQPQGGILNEIGKQVLNSPAVTGALGEVLATVAKMGAGAVLPGQSQPQAQAQPHTATVGATGIREPRTRPQTTPQPQAQPRQQTRPRSKPPQPQATAPKPPPKKKAAPPPQEAPQEKQETSTVAETEIGPVVDVDMNDIPAPAQEAEVRITEEEMKVEVTQEEYQKLEKMAEANEDPANIIEIVKAKIPENFRAIVGYIPPDDLMQMCLSEIPETSFLKTARGQRWMKQGFI